MFLISG